MNVSAGLLCGACSAACSIVPFSTVPWFTLAEELPVQCNSLLNSSMLLYEGGRVWEVMAGNRMLLIPGWGFLVYYSDCRGGLIPTTNCLLFLLKMQAVTTGSD